MARGSRPLRAAALGLAAILLVATVGTPATAQQPEQAPGEIAVPSGEGRIVGRVADEQSGAPLQGVTAILSSPEPPGGGSPRQESRITDSAGEFEFAPVPAGHYRLEFLQSGY